MYYRLMNGKRFLGKVFTIKSRAFFLAQLHPDDIPHVLWEPITAYEPQPTPDEMVDNEQIEISFGIKKVFFH